MKNFIAGLLLLTSFQTLAGPEYSDLIPHPFYAKQEGSKNELMNIESGISALKLRVDMIRRATKSIEVEYFIFNTDLAGKIIARELVKAANGPNKVKVRVLVDKSIAVFELNEFYAKELAQNNVEVRYYNAAPVYSASTVQFRNHRKILVIDDQEAITGGRNIGDDYFDLSPKFNFSDRDIYIKGPMVKTMRESFDKYFEHEIAERPTFPSQPKARKALSDYEESSKLARAFLKETEEEVAARDRMAAAAKVFFAKKQSHVCPITTFSTDAPGADFTSRIKSDFVDSHRFLRKTLYDKIVTVDKNFTISSPYMINNRESRDLFKKLSKKGVNIDLYTNSLGSTDAVYVAANLYLGIHNWMKRGVNVYLHDGKWLGEDETAPEEIRQARWGTHTKSMVFESQDYSEIMIGTYNVDNRSNFYNSEMALFCRGSDELTSEVKDGLTDIMRKGLKVNLDGTATDKDGQTMSMFAASKAAIIKMRLITLPSWLVKFLL